MNKYFVYNPNKDKFMTFLSYLSLDELYSKFRVGSNFSGVGISDNLEEILKYKTEYLEDRIKFLLSRIYNFRNKCYKSDIIELDFIYNNRLNKYSKLSKYFKITLLQS